jgi:hypothetical protein
VSTIREIIEALSKEVKDILKAYLNETETALKKRLKKLLITSIIISILLALVISFIGSASLFILIGSLEYLMTIMPAWSAWYITGITSATTGALLLLGLLLFLRKQLSSSPLPATSQPKNMVVSGTIETKDAKIINSRCRNR